MGVRLYSWKDDGAPAATSNYQDLYKIAKAVLVDGYGSKPAVGHWTIPFGDGSNNIFVLRHKSGEAYFRFNISQLFSTVHMYKTMSDENTGTQKFPTTTTGYVVSNKDRFDPSWYVLADEDGEWLYFFGGAATAVKNGFFVGNVTNEVSNFSNLCISIYKSTSMSTSTVNSCLYREYCYMMCTKSPYGVDNFGSEIVMYHDSAKNYFLQPSPMSGQLMLQKVIVEKDGVYIANMPNFYFCMGALDHLVEDFGFLNLEGRKFIYLTDSTNSKFLFEYDV